MVIRSKRHEYWLASVLAAPASALAAAALASASGASAALAAAASASLAAASLSTTAAHAALSTPCVWHCTHQTQRDGGVGRAPSPS